MKHPAPQLIQPSRTIRQWIRRPPVSRPNMLVAPLPPAIASLHTTIAARSQHGHTTTLPAPQRLPLPPL